MADKFDANMWDKSPTYQNGGDVPWSRGINLTPEQKMIAGKNIGIVTDAQIDNLIDQFHDLDGRVNVVIGNVDTALETVSSLSSDVDSALTGAQQALDTVNTITANFDVLSGKVDSNAANISSNSADIATNSSNIGTLSAKEQIDRADINTISGNVGTNAYNIGNLSARVNTISGNVSTLQSDVSGIENDITGLNSKLNTVSSVADNALASGRDALNKANAISAQWTVVSGEIEDLKDDWSAFSATEDAVITAATASIPGQVSAEVSGQLSGKQDKLTPGVNISLTTAGVIDVNHLGGSMIGQFRGFILGYNCSANNYAFAAGSQTLAGGIQSFAIGANTRALGNQSFAAGTGCSANGTYSFAIGRSSKATSYAFAHGQSTLADGEASHAEGLSTTANAPYSHAEGRMSVAQGNYSHADGDRVSAVGLYSQALGKETYAAGQNSFAIGNYARALGDESFAIGTLTRAIGADTHAEGVETSADGRGAHSEGHNTYTNAVYAHAEGESTNAIGYASHTEGYKTSAVSYYNHAEGYATLASGSYSHAEGESTIANGSRSHAEGLYTRADTDYQHVEGKYNAPATGALHVIGNGTSIANRSNIVETYTSGVNVNGNLIASGVNIIENMNTMAALPTVYSGAQSIVISPVDRDNFEMIKNSTLTGTNATFNYYNNKLYVNMDTFRDGNNTTPRFYVNGSNRHCTIERFNIDSLRVYSLFRGSSIIIDEIKEWGHYNVTEGYNYCSFYYTDIRKLPPTWEGFSGWSVSIGSRMFECATFSDIPSDYSTMHLPNSAANYNFSYMFTNNVQLSGGAVEFMDWVLAEESANNKSYIKSACFRGCTAIPNYSTLTADPTYSAFF